MPFFAESVRRPVQARSCAASRRSAEHRDRLAGQNGAGEFVNRQIWPLPRTVYREEAQTDNPQSVQMTVSMRQQLAGRLTGRVGRYRHERRVLMKRRLGRRAIDGAGG